METAHRLVNSGVASFSIFRWLTNCNFTTMSSLPWYIHSLQMWSLESTVNICRLLPGNLLPLSHIKSILLLPSQPGGVEPHAIEVSKYLPLPRCGQWSRSGQSNKGLNKKMEILREEISFFLSSFWNWMRILSAILKLRKELEAASDPSYGADSGAVARKRHRCRQRDQILAQWLNLKSTLSWSFPYLWTF